MLNLLFVSIFPLKNNNKTKQRKNKNSFPHHRANVGLQRHNGIKKKTQETSIDAPIRPCVGFSCYKWQRCVSFGKAAVSWLSDENKTLALSANFILCGVNRGPLTMNI